MILKVSCPLDINAYYLQQNLEAKARRYLMIIAYQNNLEYQNWNRYISKNFNIGLYDALLFLLRCSKISKVDNGYIINIINSPINDKLTTETLAKLLVAGNLSIKRTNILENMFNAAVV